MGRLVLGRPFRAGYSQRRKRKEKGEKEKKKKKERKKEKERKRKKEDKKGKKTRPICAGYSVFRLCRLHHCIQGP